MDLDAEMQKLAAEARQRLGPEPALDAPPADADADAARGAAAGDDEAAREARRLAEDPAEARPEGAGLARLSMGQKLAVAVGALIALNLAWAYVVKPLVGIAILLGVVALIVLGVVKLLEPSGRGAPGDGGDDGGPAA